jgi:uncharacterized protein (DUF433 family)
MRPPISDSSLAFCLLRVIYCIVSLTLEKAELVPLSVASDGAIRIGGTRVTLDAVAEAFRDGATAEEIAQQYPSLPLADVYSVLGYLLRHEAEASAYLSQRAEQRKTVRAENERRFDAEGVRARLLARRLC